MLSFPTIVIEKTVLTILLGVALLVVVAMTLIFRYHWKHFGMGEEAVSKMRRTHALVCVVLLLLSLIFYSLSVLSL